MDQYKPGEILLVKFPFSDSSDVKRRPALVLIDVGDNDVVVARVTTHRTRSSFDVEIKNWEEAGLKAASVIRLDKLATLDKSLIDRKLGKLAADDWACVQLKLRELWDSVSSEEQN